MTGLPLRELIDVEEVQEMTDVLNVKKRSELGSTACRRLRQNGFIPAVLYGHGEKSLHLSIPAGEVSAAIRHGSRLLDIKGDVSDSALMKEIQWDALGSEVLHLDLTRVSADEAVEIEINIDLRGEAPGAKEGGIVEHITHELTIECPARLIPEHLEVNINQLHLNESITAGEVELPEKATLLSDPDVIIVQCSEPKVELDEEAEVTGESAEPEVIGRAAEEEDSDSD